MKSFDVGIDILAKSMSLRLQRHSAISSNIANADTPGYRPRQVSFEESLQKAASAAQAGNSSQLNRVTTMTEVLDDKAPRVDGNSVSLDKQMGALTENTLMYNASAEFIARKFKMIKGVII